MTGTNPDNPMPGVDTSTWSPATDLTPPAWLIPNRAYDILKWVALIVLPAISVLVQTLGPVWGWTWAEPAATTINALALAIGAIIGASALKARHATGD